MHKNTSIRSKLAASTQSPPSAVRESDSATTLEMNVPSFSEFTLLTEDDVRYLTLACKKSYGLECGVPQGSCLGPLLFTIYASKLFSIIKSHLPSAHSYADDAQLYLSFRPLEGTCEAEALDAMKNCITDVRSWMINDKLNDVE